MIRLAQRSHNQLSEYVAPFFLSWKELKYSLAGGKASLEQTIYMFFHGETPRTRSLSGAGGGYEPKHFLTGSRFQPEHEENLHAKKKKKKTNKRTVHPWVEKRGRALLRCRRTSLADFFGSGHLWPVQEPNAEERGASRAHEVPRHDHLASDDFALARCFSF